MTNALKLALLGCGSVGSQVVRLLREHADDLTARIGAPVELAGVAVRRPELQRDALVPAELLTTDAAGLVGRDDIDLVVEVIGGIEPARGLILSALESGASVVTANKALLAEDSGTLFAAAEKAGRDLYFEAAVAGAIPIVRPLRESMAGDKVRRVLGIVNGTTNFILDKMDGSGAGFAEALEEAQHLGYAEADPTADVEGYDAAAKAAILASLAFHTRVTASDVYREGIAEVSAADVASAKDMGSVVKLLAICELRETPTGPAVSARVHPAMIPRTHPLASVREAYNAVFVESDAAAKAAILASLAFHSRVTASDVHREGISYVTAADVASATALGCVVKLLAIAELRANGDDEAVSVRVHPVMIPRSHPLASVRDAYNAVFVESEAAGQLMFYGPGAGGAPTASAVLGDLVTVGRHIVGGGRGTGESAYADRAVLPMGETITRYHVSLDVADKAGVLSAVAAAFADQGVSIQTVRQEGRDDDAQLVV
ncbi:MAG: homoserine dehydrogenase, partial [Nocardioidaceae bacterium]